MTLILLKVVDFFQVEARSQSGPTDDDEDKMGPWSNLKSWGRSVVGRDVSVKFRKWVKKI